MSKKHKDLYYTNQFIFLSGLIPRPIKNLTCNSHLFLNKYKRKHQHDTDPYSNNACQRATAFVSFCQLE